MALDIQDNSNDRRYFTIVPNMVLNHSTANDQALYLQLKRLAGDGKNCSPSLRYLQKHLHIGIKAIQKSLAYLIEHKWIDFLGQQTTKTAGGFQTINTYRVNDIWKLNMEFFKGAPKRTYLKNPVKPARCSQKEAKVLLEVTQGAPRSGVREEQLEEHIKNPIAATAPLAGFSLKDELEKLKKSPQRHIQLIGEYLEERKVELNNRVQLRRAIDRHARSARVLADFDDKQIHKASERAAKEYPEWTLETVVKLLTK